MRLVASAATLLLLTAMAATTTMATTTTDGYVTLFHGFKLKYNKVYATPAEEAARLRNFIHNMRTAAKMQAVNPHARFGVNGYSDVSEQEFKVKHSGEASFRAAMRKRAARTVNAGSDVGLGSGAPTPKKVDWRSKGVVTPIKNQLTCGGCWAFSTTGNIEGQWAIAGHGLVSLSEQELISCTDTCNGCHGGIMDDAFEWIVNTRGGGITSEAQYPFVSGEDVVPSCDLKGRTDVAFIANHQDIAHDEAAMAAYVAAKGPISIAVDSTSFQTYTGGVISNCVGNQVDHAVLIVGYDLSAPTPYWIVKNQWGTVWGEEGYIYLAYGSNQCLLTTLPSSAIVSSPPPLPPTGSPAPNVAPDTTNGTFTQFVCTSSTCMTGCTNTTLPNGKCLTMGATGSAISSCGATYLHLMVFNTTDCTGAWSQGMVPLNQCNPQQGGQYLYDECSATGSGSGASPITAAPAGSGSSSSAGFNGLILPAKDSQIAFRAMLGLRK